MDKFPRRMLLLPILAVCWNQLVYYGGSFLARNAPHVEMMLPLDEAIPLVPWTISIYFGCYLFWALLYVLCARQEAEKACQFFLADFLSKAVCLVFFVLLPTTMPRPEILGTTVWDDLMRFLYRIDAPYNLFPSIHCLVSWLCLIGARNHKGFPRWAVWCTGIMAVLVCISTLTTRQHVVVDVAAGILLAEGCYYAAGRSILLQPVSRLLCRLTGAEVSPLPSPVSLSSSKS